MRRLVLAWAPFVGWCALVFWLSSRPGDDVAPLLPPIPFGDKLAHAVAYALGGALAWRGLVLGHALSGGRALWWAVLITAAYGVTDEFHQAVGGAGRDADPFDLLADTLGALPGALLAARTHRRKQAFHADPPR